MRPPQLEALQRYQLEARQQYQLEARRLYQLEELFQQQMEGLSRPQQWEHPQERCHRAHHRAMQQCEDHRAQHFQRHQCLEVCRRLLLWRLLQPTGPAG